MREKASDKPSYIYIYIARTAHIFPFLLFPRRDILTQLNISKGKHLGLKPLHSEYEKLGVAATSVLSCRLVTAFLFCSEADYQKTRRKIK